MCRCPTTASARRLTLTVSVVGIHLGHRPNERNSSDNILLRLKRLTSWLGSLSHTHRICESSTQEQELGCCHARCWKDCLQVLVASPLSLRLTKVISTLLTT